MIPLYILGLLLRFGPQHGYQVKKTIAEQLSDFTQIKLPTIYYHLEKMESEGLLEAAREKPGARPEKTVYTITEAGKKAFGTLLDELLQTEYRPAFPADGLFYFAEHLQAEALNEYLKRTVVRLTRAVETIQKHKNETLAYVPEDSKTMVEIIFSHHETHYLAELNWARESLDRMERKKERETEYAETKGH